MKQQKPSQKKCPSCGGPTQKVSDPRLLPFCSARCKYVDLGKWFKEEYAIEAVEKGDENAVPDPIDS